MIKIGGFLLKSQEPIQTSEDVEALGAHLSGVLCLDRWRIAYKYASDVDMGQSLMKVMPNRDRNIATIIIRSSLLGSTVGVFGPLLLHEFVHLMIEPIAEEHATQLQYEVSIDRLKEYQKRFKRPLEQVVEHLTTQIAPLIIVDEETINQLEGALAEHHKLAERNHAMLAELYELMIEQKRTESMKENQ